MTEILIGQTLDPQGPVSVLPETAESLPQGNAILSGEIDPASETTEPLPETVETPAEAGDFLVAADSTAQDKPTLGKK